MSVEIPMREGLHTEVAQGAQIRSEPFVTCKGTANRLEIAAGASIGALGRLKIEFLGNGNTFTIGAKCNLKRGHYRFSGDNMSIVIAERTTINGAYILCMEGASVSMGIDCMLSNDIEIRTSDAHSIIDSETGMRINQARDVVLGNHVWVGKGAIMMPGTRVASNSIVGTRALVTTAFEEENVAIAGVPARIVSKNRTWDRRLL